MLVYLPALLLAGMAAGLFTGLAAQFLLGWLRGKLPDKDRL